MPVVPRSNPSTPGRTAAPFIGARREALLVLAYLAAFLAVVYPLLLVSVPPLVDYPSHLARLHILATIDANPALQEIYRVNWAVLPNLAMDIVAPPLIKAFGTYDGGRLFIGLTLALIFSGTAVLHRVLHGKFGFMPLAAALFIHNLLFFFGFLNFLFSTGLVLFALAGWIAMAGRPPAQRAVVFALVAPVLFMAHLFAFCVYALFVFSFEGRRFLAMDPRTVATAVRHWTPTLIPFAIPAILYLLSPTGGGETITYYGNIKDKVYVLAAPTTFYGTWIDRILFIAIGIVILRGLFSRKLVMAAGMGLPLLVMCVVAVAMPTRLLNTWGADFRLPVVIAFLFVASVRLRPIESRLLVGLAVVITVIFAYRIDSIAQRWQADDRRYTEFREQSKRLEAGARILVARAGHDAESPLASVAYNHLASLAVISRSIYTPGFFSDPRKQPVVIRPPYAALDVPDAEPISIARLQAGADREKSDRALSRPPYKGLRALWPFWANWPKNYDYVLILRHVPQINPVPKHLRRVSSGSFFDIYRVVR